MAVFFKSEEAQTSNDVLANKVIKNLAECPDIDSYVMFSQYAYALQNKFKGYLIVVNPSPDTKFKESSPGYTEWNHYLNELLLKENVPFFEAFAKAKYFLEKIFLGLTERGKLEYTYSRIALLTSKSLQQKLGISSSTVSRYVEHGLETVPGYGHRTYPKHNVFYWSNGVWASRVQALHETFRLRNRTKQDIFEELKVEIKKFEKKYDGDFATVFGHVVDPYELDEPDDYLNWRDFLEELQEFSE